MPKSKHRRNGKNRPSKRHLPEARQTRAKHPHYAQPCPHELLVEEFGDEGAEWLADEYERPLNLADLELEKAIRFGAFTLDHPERGAEEWPLSTLSHTLHLTTQVILVAARREGLLTQGQLEEVDFGNLDHEEDGPTNIRGSHWANSLFLNDRGLWDFGGDA